MDILKTILHIYSSYKPDSIAEKESGLVGNRIQEEGRYLEKFVQKAFSGALLDKEIRDIKEKISDSYIFCGNSNSPPDGILADGTAIEVKKLQGFSSIALNSSYPKAKLYRTDPRISLRAMSVLNKKLGSDWQETDFIYVIGRIDDYQLKTIFFVYGDIYAASHDIYTTAIKKIKDILKESDAYEEIDTKELGRLNAVDPLGISYMRIRSMWHIAHPKEVFKYLHDVDSLSNFECIALMKESKYNSLPIDSRSQIEKLNFVNHTHVYDPNNPADKIDIVKIAFKF
ncbi:NgoPII family restriction endonuclease [Cysteiniphilum marinum]|uniref:NgoPII family restriction endonuclease n=1 Tax=Cysteiniphilum marinum TaxID=2774191 RepID=UPI00193A4D52|nr:NgoPII family restriction endonuclease [Cysteiniphilum marinum]